MLYSKTITFTRGQEKEQGKWSGSLGLIELLITYASALNISQGLTHFMPILNADLLRATKIPQPDSQKRIFRRCICPCSFVSLCVCAESQPYILTPASIWWKSTFSQGWNIFLCHSIVTDGNELTLELSIIHKTQQPQCFSFGSARFIPAIPPSTCCRLLVHRCSNYWERERDHCTKESNSFSSPGIRADQRESELLCLEHMGLGGKREIEITAS